MMRTIMIIMCILLAVPVIAQDEQDAVTDGVVIVLTAPDGVTLEADGLAAVRDILTERVAALGYMDFSVRAMAPGEFMIALAGETNTEISDGVIAFLTTPGLVEFVNFAGVPLEMLDSFVGETIVTSAQVERSLSDDPPAAEFGTVLTGERIVTARAFGRSGGGFGEVLDALAGEDTEDEDTVGDWMVEFTLDEDGADLLFEYTSANIGFPLAIVINGEVVSVPIVNDTLSDSGVIAGLTRAEAVTLAEQLNSGILPVRLSLETVTAYTEARPVIEEEE